MVPTGEIVPEGDDLPSTFDDYSRRVAQERFRIFSAIGGVGYLFIALTGRFLYPEIPSAGHDKATLYRIAISACFFLLAWRASTVPLGQFQSRRWGLVLMLLMLLGYDRWIYITSGVMGAAAGHTAAVFLGWMIMMPGGARDNFLYFAAMLCANLIPQLFWPNPFTVYQILQANEPMPVLFGLAVAGMHVLELHRHREYDAQKQILDQNEILKRSAHYDPLTGAGNRRYFSERLEEQFRLAGRHRQPLSLIMLDLDHFKRVNDEFGHRAGDEILKGVSQVIRPLLRTGDVFARYGGEEFVILLPSTDITGGRRLAERLRRAVEETVFSQNGLELRQTISLGVAQHTGEHNDPEALLELADQGLYRAKNAGRNRVGE